MTCWGWREPLLQAKGEERGLKKKKLSINCYCGRFRVPAFLFCTNDLISGVPGCWGQLTNAVIGPLLILVDRLTAFNWLVFIFSYFITRQSTLGGRAELIQPRSSASERPEAPNWQVNLPAGSDWQSVNSEPAATSCVCLVFISVWPLWPGRQVAIAVTWSAQSGRIECVWLLWILQFILSVCLTVTVAVFPSPGESRKS